MRRRKGLTLAALAALCALTVAPAPTVAAPNHESVGAGAGAGAQAAGWANEQAAQSTVTAGTIPATAVGSCTYEGATTPTVRILWTAPDIAVSQSGGGGMASTSADLRVMVTTAGKPTYVKVPPGKVATSPRQQPGAQATTISLAALQTALDKPEARQFTFTVSTVLAFSQGGSSSVWQGPPAAWTLNVAPNQKTGTCAAAKG